MITADDVRRMRAMRADGMSWRAIGRELGISGETAKAHADDGRELNVVSPAEERLMRAMRADGASVKEIAAETGRGASTVSRHTAGPLSVRRRPWSHEEDAELRRVGHLGYAAAHPERSPNAAYARARKLGLVGRREQPPELTEEQASLLGAMPDGEAARELGITREAARRARAARGIPPFSVWDGVDTGELGTMPDRDFARRWGVSVKSVFNMRMRLGIGAHTQWTPEAVAMLGTMSDREVSERTGIPKGTVTGMRMRLGIGPAGGGAS